MDHTHKGSLENFILVNVLEHLTAIYLSMATHKKYIFLIPKNLNTNFIPEEWKSPQFFQEQIESLTDH